MVIDVLCAAGERCWSSDRAPACRRGGGGRLNEVIHCFCGCRFGATSLASCGTSGGSACPVGLAHRARSSTRNRNPETMRCRSSLQRYWAMVEVWVHSVGIEVVG